MKNCKFCLQIVYVNSSLSFFVFFLYYWKDFPTGIYTWSRDLRKERCVWGSRKEVYTYTWWKNNWSKSVLKKKKKHWVQTTFEQFSNLNYKIKSRFSFFLGSFLCMGTPFVSFLKQIASNSNRSKKKKGKPVASCSLRTFPSVTQATTNFQRPPPDR